MIDLSNYPYATYEPNQIAAGILAGVIGISLIGWLAQATRKFRRLIILLTISHVTIFIELVLRAALSSSERKSRASFTATSVLLAVGQRTIILANYDYIVRVGEVKPAITRCVIIGPILIALTSAALMIPAGMLSYNKSTIPQSFALRQASAAIVLGLTILFYPIWFALKTWKDMKKQSIIRLLISSIACLSVAIYLQITSVPDYYITTSHEEYWFYIFQFTPMAIALLTWTFLHPRRSLQADVNTSEL
ncbi:unnamed protein product [Adineta ricciae]|uniref:Uncharacterized protein n=1 Tax=Adineta ricciae TaxID=249248 RepID=A0A814CZL4_ADIRI|nr:unnamed protein product [Adineta ricciae]CAF1096896.1 unnamed protein product [Adineta ricciae]